MKHGKKVVDEQLPLKRVAEVTMDLYAMAAVTSRATAALNSQGSTASHEKLLALGTHFLFQAYKQRPVCSSFHFFLPLAYCKDADQRITAKIADIKDSKKTIDRQVYEIADAVFAKGGYVPEHPLKV